MPKTLRRSEVAQELRKEYLRQHLDEVGSLIRTLMSDLHPPEPFAPRDHFWGWESAYSPSTLSNPENNHTIRRHLGSRALWSHHSRWEQEIKRIWELTQQLRSKALGKEKTQSRHKPWSYSRDYSAIALWQGFGLALGRKADLPFRVPGSQTGLAYGAYVIEESAGTPEVRLIIEKEYTKFIRYLSRTIEMKQLVRSWAVANDLESRMLAIAGTALKSNDLFHMCKFCKHLW